jgi:asparagine synthase (glutamine-hydrolysing)
MCGIAGIITKNHNAEAREAAIKMANTLRHRGPDGHGIWSNSSNHVHFAHTRLAIIDLSESASQPMHYLGRYSIVYNGEIYNYIEIRESLKKAGLNFETQSDTEVILAAYHHYGQACLQEFDGMFSFAIWDEKEQTLFAARDPYGEKPFYYAIDEEKFCFASEMKALFSVGIPKEADEEMKMKYFALGILKDPSDLGKTCYKNIRSLPAGHWLMHRNGKIEERKYHEEKADKTGDNDVAQLDDAIRESVSRRLRSDVPVGIGLSGGLDSSSLLWYMSQHRTTPITSISAVFPGFEKDESRHIEQMAKRFNSTNISITPNENELLQDFETLMFHQEEPISSSSVYAQFRVYKQAKEAGIKVMLEGQGADEIFGGYEKYIPWFLQEQIKQFRFIKAAKEKNKLSNNGYCFNWGIENYAAAFFPGTTAQMLEKKADQRLLKNPWLGEHWKEILSTSELEIKKPVVNGFQDILSYDRNGMNLEVLLRYADRNSMAHGVEVRLPFLNRKLIAGVAGMSADQLIHDGYSKYVLRKLMKDRLPNEIVWRTDKVAYEPPQEKWMQGKKMQEFIHESRRSLVNKKLLSASVLNQKITASPAHDAENTDWRILNLAHMM